MDCDGQSLTLVISHSALVSFVGADEAITGGLDIAAPGLSECRGEECRAGRVETKAIACGQDKVRAWGQKSQGLALSQGSQAGGREGQEEGERW